MHQTVDQPFPRLRRLLLAVLALSLPSLAPAAAPQTLAVQVWKDPNCGCCKDWITHLEKSGFRVSAVDQGNSAARTRLGMPQKFGSCHTALIQGYVIEGHVPATDIQRLSRKSPKPWAWRCRACPLVHPAWMVSPTEDAVMPTKSCWLGKTEQRKFSVLIREETMH